MPTSNRTSAYSGATTFSIERVVGKAAISYRPGHSTIGRQRELIGFAFLPDSRDLNEYGLLEEYVSFDGDSFWDDLLTEVIKGWNEEDPDGRAL